MKTILVPESGGECGVSCIKIIKQNFNNIRVVALDTNEYSPSRCLADVFYITSPSIDSKYQVELDAIVKKENVDLILPTFEHGINNYAKYSNICKFDFDSADCVKDKYKFYKFLESHKLPFIPTYLLNNINILKNINGQYYIKPRIGSGSKLNFQAKNKISLIKLRDYLKIEYPHIEFIVQPSIYGIHWATDVVADSKGNLIKVATRKNLQLQGSKCLAVSTSQSIKIKSFISKFQETFKLKMPYNLEIFETTDGKLLPLEVNLRFGGGLIYSYLSGFDVVSYYITNDLKYLKNPKKESYTSYKHEVKI